MEENVLPTLAGDLARRVGAQLIGDPDAAIIQVSALPEAGEGSVTYLASAKYANHLEHIERAVVLTREEFVRRDRPLTYLICNNPQEVFAELASSSRRRAPAPGVSPLASVSPTARVADGVYIGPFAVIADEAQVGEGAKIYSHAVVGSGARVGAQSEVREHAVLGGDCVVGDRVLIFAGTVIGSDGFGLFTGASGFNREMPQVGNVIIEDDCRIGANCTIDRGTLGPTRVRKRTKIDDQVHIGHNCEIGEDTVICAQVGLGGSVIVGRNVVIAGQVGVSHGVCIGDRVQIAAQSGVNSDLKTGETYFLSPAIPQKEAFRLIRSWRRLSNLFERVKNLEQKIDVEGEVRG